MEAPPAPQMQSALKAGQEQRTRRSRWVADRALTQGHQGPAGWCRCLMPSFHCAPCWGRVTWRKEDLELNGSRLYPRGWLAAGFSQRQRYFLSCGPCSSLHALCLRPGLPLQPPSTPHHTIHSHNQRLNTAISRCEAAVAQWPLGPVALKLITTRHN